MARKPSAAERLDDYSKGRIDAPFHWGVANCCHWPAGWVLACEGFDPMEGLKATPTPAAARRLIKSLGGSLVAAWTKQLGREPIAPTLAQIGDVVVIPLDADRQTTGVCAGRDALCVDDAGKVVRVPMGAAIAAWRIAEPA